MADQELRLKIIPDLSEVQSQLGKLSIGGVSGGGGSSSSSNKSTSMLSSISDGIGGLLGLFKGILPIMSIFFKIATAIFLILLLPFLTEGIKIFAKVLPGILEFVKSISEKLKEFVTKLLSGDVAGAMQAGGEAIGMVAGAAVDIGTSIFNFIMENLPIWLASLAELGGNLLTFIGENWGKWMESLANLGTNLVTWFSENAPKIFQGLLDAGTALYNWIYENSDEILIALLDTGAGLLGWIIDNLPIILGTLYEMGKKLLGWVVDNLPTIFLTLLNLGATLIGWVIAHLPDMLNALLTIGDKILNAIITVITDSLNAVSNFGGMIFNALTGSGKVNGTSIMGGAGDFIFRPGQSPLEFSPSDTLIGFKNGSNLGGSSGSINYSPNYNISADVDGMALKRVLQEHDREFLNKLRGFGTAGGRILNA